MTATDAATAGTTATDLDAWEVVIGLEVHAELATNTKIFCGCPNRFGDEPNTNVCPVCMGLPGSLPVLNRQVVECAIRLGDALHCEVRPSVFHRKNYFYPDMPKDFQVTQYDQPITADGWLELPDGSRVGITRAHLEEDTGKSTHLGGDGRLHGATGALVDYNRAGVPLLEIVSEPDIRSAEQAKAYVGELRAILAATGVSDAKMEEGSMRVDANVSVRPVGTAAYGTRCEIKNLNSIRSLGRAIEYEVRRQVDLVATGGRVKQETRGWDEQEGRTHSQRSKEEADDYRYFPEPDLVTIAPDEAWLARVLADQPALPADRRARLAEAAGRAPSDAAVVVAVERGLDDLALAALAAGGDPGRVLVHVEHNLSGEGADALDAVALAELSKLEVAGKLTATQAKAVLADLVAAGGTGDPAALAAARGFEAMDDAALVAAVDAAIAANAGAWEKYRNGEAKAVGALVGAVMKATQGKADGKAVTALLEARKAG